MMKSLHCPIKNGTLKDTLRIQPSSRIIFPHAAIASTKKA
jgi:hypothetical protein